MLPMFARAPANQKYGIRNKQGQKSSAHLSRKTETNKLRQKHIQRKKTTKSWGSALGCWESRCQRVSVGWPPNMFGWMRLGKTTDETHDKRKVKVTTLNTNTSWNQNSLNIPLTYWWYLFSATCYWGIGCLSIMTCGYLSLPWNRYYTRSLFRV